MEESRLNWHHAVALWSLYINSKDKHTRKLYHDAYRSVPTDTKITCIDGVVHTFAAALVSRSDVFRAMLSGNFAESIDNISLPTDTVEDVNDLATYISFGYVPKYLKEFKMEYFDRANRLLDLARRFDIKGLEFETYTYRIKNIFSIDRYFKEYSGFSPNDFPGNIAYDLRDYCPGNGKYNALYELRVNLQRRFSCKLRLVLEPMNNEHVLNFINDDGDEIYSCRIPQKYVAACEKIINSHEFNE